MYTVTMHHAISKKALEAHPHFNRDGIFDYTDLVGYFASILEMTPLKRSTLCRKGIIVNSKEFRCGEIIRYNHMGPGICINEVQQNHYRITEVI